MYLLKITLWICDIKQASQLDRKGIRLWQVTRCIFFEPDIVLFSKVHACGENCVMLTHDYVVSTESSVN
jgi:hypothetical protein